MGKKKNKKKSKGRRNKKTSHENGGGSQQQGESSASTPARQDSVVENTVGKGSPVSQNAANIPTNSIAVRRKSNASKQKSTDTSLSHAIKPSASSSQLSQAALRGFLQDFVAKSFVDWLYSGRIIKGLDMMEQFQFSPLEAFGIVAEAQEHSISRVGHKLADHSKAISQMDPRLEKMESDVEDARKHLVALRDASVNLLLKTINDSRIEKQQSMQADEDSKYALETLAMAIRSICRESWISRFDSKRKCKQADLLDSETGERLVVAPRVVGRYAPKHFIRQSKN